MVKIYKTCTCVQNDEELDMDANQFRNHFSNLFIFYLRFDEIRF